MFVTMLDQAPALPSVRQRRLAMLVIAALLVSYAFRNRLTGAP